MRRPVKTRQSNFRSLPRQRLRLLSYNAQAGINTRQFSQYITQAWRHVIAHKESRRIMDDIAQLVRDYDIVALQELDGGSLRSNFLNQVTHLAHMGGFDFWHQQTNRNFGSVGQFSNAMFARFSPYRIEDHPLPGTRGRGAIMMQFGRPEEPLVVIGMHLALSARAQKKQLDYVHSVIDRYEHVVLMGDLNCHEQQITHSSLHRRDLLAYRRDLAQETLDSLATYPAWKPDRLIDHILISPSIRVLDIKALDVQHSDHRPIAAEIELPAHIVLDGDD